MHFIRFSAVLVTNPQWLYRQRRTRKKRFVIFMRWSRGGGASILDDGGLRFERGYNFVVVIPKKADQNFFKVGWGGGFRMITISLTKPLGCKVLRVLHPI